MGKKILKLVDRRACGGQAVREMRDIVRGIEAGEIVSVASVYIRRNGTMHAYFDSDCPIRTLGSVDLLKDYIRVKKFESS